MQTSRSRFLFVWVLFLSAVFCAPSTSAFAYYTDISASVVLGQQNFTSGSSNQGGIAGLNTMSAPASVTAGGGQLFTADNGNNRILVFPTIPTSNNASANFVIGQTTSNGTSASCAQNRLSMGDGRILYVGGKLIVADTTNNRVLIYNSIPTTTGANADVVIGQAGFTTCTANQGGSVGGNTLSGPIGLATNGTNLIVSDSGNNRVLIFNTIPTGSNATANIVLGQSAANTNTANNGGISAHSLSNPQGIALNSDGRLIIADTSNNRVLNFNTTPSNNNANADSVLGQSLFTTNTFSTVNATTMQPTDVAFDGSGRLYVSDKIDSRVLVFGSIPAANAPSADIVIGQVTLSGSGTFLAADGLSGPKGVFVLGNQLFIADAGYNRVLVYNNAASSPSLTLDGSTAGQPDGPLLRLGGIATVDPKYFVKNVEYSVNYSTWTGTQPTDGQFNDDSIEDFFFDFDPTTNLPLTAPVGDYTIRIRSTNNNNDITSNAFYFQPFSLTGPADNIFLETPLPTFDFSVSSQRQAMKENVSKYQILMKKLNTNAWLVYLDNIPVDFFSTKGNSDNIRANTYKNITTNEGIYENSTFIASYSAQSSRVQITAKDINGKSFFSGGKLLPSGAYQWKVAAFDNQGHEQDTQDNSGVFRVNSYQSLASATFFPLTISYISGLGNVDLSSIHPEDIADSYTIDRTNPTLSGIAFMGAQVDLIITDSNCTAINQCKNTYTTTADQKSQWTITIPQKDLTFGKTYTFSLSTTLKDNYTELPDFSVAMGEDTTSTGKTGMLLKKTIGTGLLSTSDAPSAHLYPRIGIKTKASKVNTLGSIIFDNFLPPSQFSAKRFLQSKTKPLV